MSKFQFSFFWSCAQEIYNIKLNCFYNYNVSFCSIRQAAFTHNEIISYMCNPLIMFSRHYNVHPIIDCLLLLKNQSVRNSWFIYNFVLIIIHIYSWTSFQNVALNTLFPPLILKLNLLDRMMSSHVRSAHWQIWWL